jgi:hypothetical protein
VSAEKVGVMVDSNASRVNDAQMTSASLAHAWDLSVGMENGLFYLLTDDPYAGADTEEHRLTEHAAAGTGIAQHFGTIVVISPHRRNFSMPLRVEVWDGRPEDTLDSWQEIFETDLKVGRDGLVYDSPRLSSFKMPVPAGEYHAIIAGQGFSQHEKTDTTTPGDRWRIQLYPCTDKHGAVRVRSWLETVAPEETEEVDERLTS